MTERLLSVSLLSSLVLLVLLWSLLPWLGPGCKQDTLCGSGTGGRPVCALALESSARAARARPAEARLTRAPTQGSAKLVPRSWSRAKSYMYGGSKVGTTEQEISEKT